MATSKSYFAFIADQLSAAQDVSFRPMMGEYVVYCGGKVVGGVYDDRLLVKPTAAARALMPAASSELPYEGAKPMLLVEQADDRDFLIRLLRAVADDLPAAKPKKK